MSGDLQPAAQDIPRDSALPGLATALDAAAMELVFAAVLRDHGADVAACRIDRVKYRPKQSCTVSYVLRVRGVNGIFEQRVAARVCAHGDAARRAGKLVQQSLKPSPAGPTATHLASLDFVAVWWPNDPKLLAPRVLAEDALLRGAVLPEVLAALDARPCRLARHELDVVQYVAESRVAARVVLDWCAPGETESRFRRTLYVKADRASNGAATHAVMRALEASAAAQAGQLRTPRSVLWQETFGLHWQEAVPGRPLLDVQPQAGSAVSVQVGLHLAALHGVPTPLLRVTTADALRRRPHELALMLGDIDRTWMQPLLRLALQLEQGVAAIDGAKLVTLHGDLHPRNVLVDVSGGLWLIDFDAARRGPALLDLGAWIAETMYRALLKGDDPARATPAWQALLAGYAAGGGEFFDERALAWATALQLVERARRCVTNLKPGRLALVPHLVALAAAILHAGTPRGAESPSPRRSRERGRPHAPRVRLSRSTI